VAKKQGSLESEETRLQAELEEARTSFAKELRNFLVLLGIFVLGATLELWLSHTANFYRFVIVLFVGPFGAASLYIAIRVLMAWNEMGALNRRRELLLACLKGIASRKHKV
jgi:hypothetical protein